ncbi:DegT/DnrJ/EryC1/StrS family aminotransferase [Kineococcus gynurae]|uniref:DegT/DnrJ/EryC1/StrS family aminotransferase n=1 Tax=Kineococcus gynurae TaxID=452979 RepID=A0ABV5LRJ8_9ACTN
MIPVAAPQLGAEEQAAVAAVLAGGNLVQGPEVAAFEAEFCAEVVPGTRGIAVNSGTSALHVALLAAGIGTGDEVVVPSFTFAATANAVRLCGAVPVFADIDPVSFCLDPRAAAEAVTARTRAVVPVHLFGHPADLDAFEALAAEHDLRIVEDAAQAHGAHWRGRAVGAVGDASAFSFYPTKNMTSGEGGMVTTASPVIERTCRLLRNQGMEQRYRNEIVGLNYRMTDLHAAIGRVQLRRLAGFTAARRRTAERLGAAITARATPGVVVPTAAAGAEPVWHQYTVRLSDAGAEVRDAVLEGLGRRGVGAGVYYPVPVHRLPAHADLPASALRSDSLPHTDLAASQVLALPVHPAVTEADVEVIADALDAAVREVGGSA